MKIKKFNEEFLNFNREQYDRDPVDYLADHMKEISTEYIIDKIPKLGKELENGDLKLFKIEEDVMSYDEIYQWSKYFLDMVIKKYKEYLIFNKI